MTISWIPERDSEGNILWKNLVALKDMIFKPRCFDFTTGKADSLCNKSSDGTNLGDAEVWFYDENFNQLVQQENESDQDYQTRLDQNCTNTWLIYTPTKKYAIKSGEIRYVGTLGDEQDIWIEIAPHIPKIYGGSVPIMDGGIPLDFYNQREQILIDGAACAVMNVDTEYYSHRLGVKINHDLGARIDILAVFNKYE